MSHDVQPLFLISEQLVVIVLKSPESVISIRDVNGVILCILWALIELSTNSSRSNYDRCTNLHMHILTGICRKAKFRQHWIIIYQILLYDNYVTILLTRPQNG